MEILENISLKPFNTFGIDQQARYFINVRRTDELAEALTWAGSKNTEVLPLGGGSNILFTRDYAGAVLKNELKGYSVTAEDEDYVYLQAGGGEIWHQFVLYCLENNYAGVENLALIPGSVGAAPIQNIGAYGMELKDVFYELTAIDRRGYKLQVFTREDCEFGYRSSVFKNRFKDAFIITAVTFRLRKKPVFHIEYGAIRQELERMNVTTLSIQQIAQAVMKIRSSKLPDPAVTGNAGSFFKNPSVLLSQYVSLKKAYPDIVAYENPDGTMKLAAGWLIEQAGLKGYRKGAAGVHEKQALVLVNYGGAKGQELLELRDLVIKTVFEKYGVKLEPEVNIL